MTTKETTVQNPTGLHARPAAAFVTEAKRFASKILIANLDRGGEAVNAKSIVRLLTLSLGQGVRVSISAEGPDEQEAADSLIGLIDGGFGEL